MTFQISLKDYSSKIIREYQEGITLNTVYEVGLKSFVTFNNIPNISSENSNNQFVYEVDNGPTNTVTIPTGTYELHELIQYIKDHVPKDTVFFRLHKNTMILEIVSNYVIDFSTRNSVGSILGFSKRKLAKTVPAYSDLPIEIFHVNIIKIKCNLINSNVDDLKRNDNTVYEFPLNVGTGEKIIERPNNILYYPVTKDVIHELVIRIVDQDDRLVDFRKEQICITLNFQPAYKYTGHRNI